MIINNLTRLVLQIVCTLSAKWAVRRANWFSRHRRLQMVVDTVATALIHYAIFHTDTVIAVLNELLRWLL